MMNTMEIIALVQKEKSKTYLCLANQYGTKKEIKAELERWKKEVDFDNPRMLEVEAFFISVLTHCEN